MEEVTRIRQLVRRVRWRVRVQTALRRLLVFGAAALFLFGVTVLLVKGRVLPPVATWIAGGVAAAVAASASLSGLLARWDDIRLAARLDEASHLHSRLGSALAFSRVDQPNAFQRAAIADAASALERAEPSAAAPWQWATFTVAAAFAVVALALNIPAIFVVTFPVGAEDAHAVAALTIPPNKPADRDKVAVTALDKETLEELSDDLEEAKERATDDEVSELLGDLNDLLRKLQEGEITAEEAFRELAALEAAKEAWDAEHARDLDEVTRHIEEAAKKQRRAHEEVDPFFEALRQQRWKEAAEALERAAEKLDRDELAKRDKDRISKDLEELAKDLETERQRQLERLQRERDRLKKQEEREKDRFAQKDRDRLKKTERELEQLRREQEGLSEARRQLERLQRGLSQAAQDMLRRQAEQQQGEQGGGGGAEELRRAAEQLRRMAESGQGARQLRVAEGRMVDVREMLRRAGQRKGEGQDGQDGQDGQQAGKDGQQGGKDGEQGGQGGKEGEMGRFLVRAGGKDGGQGGQGGEQGGEGGDKPGVLDKGAGGGKDGMVLLGQGGPGQPGGARLPVPGQGDGPGGEADVGEGVGEGHDPNMHGDKTRMEGVRHEEEFVRGPQGDEGDSESVVLQTAASKGFTSARYRRVHQDYSEVVEDALERQEIPPGARRYVRRYFDLIRPR